VVERLTSRAWGFVLPSLELCTEVKGLYVMKVVTLECFNICTSAGHITLVDALVNC
jgi:hypothetical protein